MGVLSSSGASWSSKPTLSRITPSHFSSSSSLRNRQRHLTRNLVSLRNAQFLLVAFCWAVTYRRGTGVSIRQFTKDIHTKLPPETKCHTLGNPTPSSYQRSNVIGVCTDFLFSPCPSPRPTTQQPRLDPHNIQNAKRIDIQHDPPAFDARRRLPQNPQGTQLQLAL